MQGVALAAEQIAYKGNHEKAASLAISVAAALHDSFLTDAPERSKIDSNGAVVYVPESASKSRRKRFYKIHKSMPYECLSKPQAYNQGLMAAQGAIALLRACNIINWTKVKWNLVDGNSIAVERSDFMKLLETFLQDSAKVLRGAFITMKTSSEDYYLGDNGVEFYQWKYRNTTQCPALHKNPRKNRWEDISHIEYELKAVFNFVKVGKLVHGNQLHFGFQRKHMRRILISILARMIKNRSIIGGNRFSCDMSGSTTNKKSCSRSRAEEVRVKKAVNLIVGSNMAAKNDSKTICNSLDLVANVLPMFITGHEQFHPQNTFEEKCNGYNIWPLIEAKYYYYWYEAGRNMLGCQ